MNPTNENGNFIPTGNNIELHDIVVIKKIAMPDNQTDRWREFSKIGVVTEISEHSMKIIEPDHGEYEYQTYEADKETGFFYAINRGSEVEYIALINKEIDRQRKAMSDANIKAAELLEWRDDFQNSISMFHRMARFIKAFKN